MVIDRTRKYREMVQRGKYRRLYTHLCALPGSEWRVSFEEIEAIIGFKLPASARLYRPWWSNQSEGSGHSQALAWSLAGWDTAEVDLDSETLSFRKRDRAERVREVSLDEVWPVHATAKWPEGLSLRREDLYEERV